MDDRTTSATETLPSHFRKLDYSERRRALAETFPLTTTELEITSPSTDTGELADVLVENAVGCFAIPVGVVPRYAIDGVLRTIPLATEEPSVVAAASFAAGIISRSGGATTWADAPVMTAQIVLENAAPNAPDLIVSDAARIEQILEPVLAGMTRRGGGFRGVEAVRLVGTDLVRVHVHVDVRDAMGANILNTAAERLRKPLERLTGGTVLMAILTNASDRRLAGAEIRLPVSRLGRAERSGPEMARRIVLANRFADEDVPRAVTHNKGIMNGVTAIAIATANDSRALEAAVHAYAARDGRYRVLTEYEVVDDELVGKIRLPIPLATVGGATGFHPGASLALKLLGSPDAEGLSRIAAAVGLAQNFAALSALVGEGIQSGHMRLHAERVAWKAGARGRHIRIVAERLAATGMIEHEAAVRELQRVIESESR